MMAQARATLASSLSLISTVSIVLLIQFSVLDPRIMTSSSKLVMGQILCTYSGRYCFWNQHIFLKRNRLKGPGLLSFNSMVVMESMCVINGLYKASLSNPGSPAANKLVVGTNRNADSGINGWVGEILTGFHKAYGEHTNKVERYLMGKWGVDATLPNNSAVTADDVGGAGSGGSIYLKLLLIW